MEGKDCFTKVYPMKELPEDKLKGLFENWRISGTECAVLYSKYMEGSYFLLKEKYSDITEAMEKFAETEKYLELKALSAEQRLEEYCRHMSKVLGEAYRTERYLFETPEWKVAASMDKLKVEQGELVTPAGYFAVMAVRRFPEEITEGIFQKLEEKDYVMALCYSILKVSDKRVGQVMEEEYLGLDGVLPGMRRKSPALYHILKGEDCLEEAGSFIEVGVYFLLYAASMEEFHQRLMDFSKTAGECGGGVRVEKIPLAELKGTREIKETIAMFGLMGCSKNRYGNIVPADDAISNLLIPVLRKKEQNGEEYDVEKMRRLFFGGKEWREENRNEQK